MVVYNLICKKNHQFEGWFPSFEDFQKQAEQKLISCPTCGSKRVERCPMPAPSMSKRNSRSSEKGRATGGDASDTAIAR